MQASDKQAFVGRIEALAAAFGARSSEALFEGYWLGLQSLNLREFEGAVRRAIEECERMPKPIELRKLAGLVTPEDRAIKAWDVVSRSVGSIGCYASVDFDDPVINATIRNMGGWEKLCTTSADEFGVWARKDFERIYCSLCRQGVTAEAVGYLAGRTERENSGSDWGGRLDLTPRRVLVGLPPHPASVVRALGEHTAQKQLREVQQAIAAVKRLDEHAA